MTGLILGGADCLWDDLAQANELVPPLERVYIATNAAGIGWPIVDHWVSLHPDLFQAWGIIRSEMWPATANSYTTWTRSAAVGQAERIVQHWDDGSTGLLAVSVASTLRVEGVIGRVILCGVPMEGRPHFNDHDMWGSEPWPEADAKWPAWERSLWRMEGWVTSMSGRTRELLGAPA